MGAVKAPTIQRSNPCRRSRQSVSTSLSRPFRVHGVNAAGELVIRRQLKRRADPVRFGLVASLNRPGGNITGVSYLANTILEKQLNGGPPDAAIFIISFRGDGTQETETPCQEHGL